MTARQTPPEGHGPPAPAAGDGQGGAAAEKNQTCVVTDKDRIKTELACATKDYEFALARWEAAKDVCSCNDDASDEEKKALLELSRKEYTRARMRLKEASKRAVEVILEPRS